MSARIHRSPLRQLALLGVVCLSCKDSSRPSSAPTDESALRGIIDDAPFIARAAALVLPNRPGRACYTPPDGTGECVSETEFVSSTLRITEVAGSCADFEARQMPATRPGRSVEIEIHAPWPVPARTSLRTDVTDKRQPHLEAGVLSPGSTHLGDRWVGNDLIAEGSITIISSSAKNGVVAVDLHTSETDYVRGQIAFFVCPY